MKRSALIGQELVSLAADTCDWLRAVEGGRESSAVPRAARDGRERAAGDGACPEPQDRGSGRRGALHPTQSLPPECPQKRKQLLGENGFKLREKPSFSIIVFTS